MDVLAEHLAQRGVQQVRGRVVALVAWRAARSTSASTRSPGSSAPSTGSTTSAWSSPARTTPTTRARQSPSSHSSVPDVGDLAAALGVEGRLGQLDEQLPVGSLDRRDRRALVERLVAGEVASAAPATLADLRQPRAARRARASRARCSSISGSKLVLAAEGHAALGRELEREVEREAVGVVQPEGVVGADALARAAERGRPGASCPARACARSDSSSAARPLVDRGALLAPAPGTPRPSSRPRGR